MTEFDERTEAAAKVKLLGEVPALIEDLVLTDPAETEPRQLDEAERAQALARLDDDRVPITPEQIDAAAQKYYRDRVRRSLLGAVAGPVGIVLAIWAISSIASGQFIFFWPIFVIIPMLFGGLGRIAHKDEIIRNRKKELTRRARAHLGDAEAKRQLEQGEAPERDYEATSAPDCSRRLRPTRRTPPARPHAGMRGTVAGGSAATTATTPGAEGMFRIWEVLLRLRLERPVSARSPVLCAW